MQCINVSHMRCTPGGGGGQRQGKGRGEVTLNTSHLPGVQCSSLFSPVDVAPVMTSAPLAEAISMTSSRLRHFVQGTQKRGATRGVAATSP